MADGFIVRKGGVTTEQALAPTITEVSTTATSITFTITNNDASTAVILYEVDDTTPDANSIELATGATSSNLTITGLTSETAFNVYATANVTGKVKSNVTEKEITTDVPNPFTEATGGTTLEYDSGGKRFRSHTFTSDGNFVVTNVGDNVDDRNKVDYLIIAGGGGGGGAIRGGGGGAGGYRTTLGNQGGLGTLDPKYTVTATTFSVIVGGGGSSGPYFIDNSDARGVTGTNSSALGITSFGGGGGGASDSAPPRNGLPGGSGGGGWFFGTGGTGTANQGFNGGNGNPSSPYPGGGGGGAGSAGQNGNNIPGNGLSNTLRTGLAETRAGGGSSSNYNTNNNVAGGTGGGGIGRNATGTTVGIAPSNATVNTGSGGGASGDGGSGIVVIRYEIATV